MSLRRVFRRFIGYSGAHLRKTPLEISLEYLDQEIDVFINNLQHFASQHTKYKGKEIKNFKDYVIYFKNMFCCESPTVCSGVHEERLSVGGSNYYIQRNEDDVAELRKLLAEKDKELKAENLRRIKCEVELFKRKMDYQEALEQFQNNGTEDHLCLEHLLHRNEKLNDEVKMLKKKNSALMSTQEEFFVDFKDKFLPRKIAAMCKTLFREQYSDARHLMKEKKYTDNEVYEILEKIFVNANKLTMKTIKEEENGTKKAVHEALSTNHFEKNDDKNLPKELENEIYRRLRQYPSKEKQRFLVEKLMVPYHRVTARDTSFTRYVEECVRVTWLMNASSPPMYASFADQNVSSEKHEVRHGNGDKIRYWISPCIYFSEEAYRNDEDVLVMGIVVTD